MARAKVFRAAEQVKNFEEIEDLDFDWEPNDTAATSSLAPFRTGAKANLMRTTLFLLQVLVLILTYYEPSEDLKKQYGVGYRSAPRLALLFLLETEINEKTWERLCNVKRQLFMKALEEGANIKALTDALKTEWSADTTKEADEALSDDFFHEHVVPAVLDGRLPRLNFQTDLPPQYDHCWKDTDT